MISFKDIYISLFRCYGEQHWWPAKTPFEMMVGAILTQNTAWSNVEKAIANFNGAPEPDFILKAGLDEIAAIVRPSGFFNQKAVRLKRLTEWYFRYDCNIEALKASDPEKIREELLSLSGVGRETADSILLYALEKPYFIIDAYTRRVFDRLGLDTAGDYDDVRRVFEHELPRDAALYNEYHALIVYHAKTRCKKAPACSGCPLISFCRHEPGEADSANPQQSS